MSSTAESFAIAGEEGHAIASSSSGFVGGSETYRVTLYYAFFPSALLPSFTSSSFLSVAIQSAGRPRIVVHACVVVVESKRSHVALRIWEDSKWSSGVHIVKIEIMFARG